MNVVVGHPRHVEVDDVAERLDVDAARRDVGRDENRISPALEAGERLRALALRPVAVNPLGLHALMRQIIRELVGAVLGPREHQRLPEDVAAEQLEQQRRLEILRYGVGRLCDADGGRRLPLQADRHRLFQHLRRQRRNGRGHRRAEEQRLPLCGNVTEDPPDVRQEAHVEHAIGFVEHEVLEAIELRIGRARVVEQAARGRHDHVDSAPERVLLGTHPDAAVDRGAGEGGVDRKPVEVFENLRGKLARGRQHQDPRDAARPVDQAMQDRQQERRGLAASSLRAREQVAALERRRDRHFLDGSRPDETELPDALEQVGVQPERCERHTLTRPSASSAPGRSRS